MRSGRRLTALLLSAGVLFSLLTWHGSQESLFSPAAGQLVLNRPALGAPVLAPSPAAAPVALPRGAGALSDPPGWLAAAAGATAAVAAFVAARRAPTEDGRLPLLPAKEVPQRHASLRMAMVEPGKFKKGQTIEMEDAIWKVMDFQQSKTARQAAVVRTKLKNLLSGATTEKTFRLKEAVPTAELEKRAATYSYEDDGDFVLYDLETSDELRVKTDSVMNGDLMPAGSEVVVRQWNGVVVDVEMPAQVTLEVTYTEAGIAGDRANPGKKPADVETGAKVQVPLFINENERIIVNTETREYVGRADTKDMN